MAELGTVGDTVDAMLDAVASSTDPNTVDSTFSAAIDTVHGAAAGAGGASADALEAHALSIAARRELALRRLALERKDYPEADRRDEQRVKCFRDLIAFLEQKIKGGRTVAELGNDPKYIVAFIDEDGANYLLDRYGADAPALKQNAGRIEARARSGIHQYEAIDAKSDAADCYMTLGNLYRATGELEKAGDSLIRAATLLDEEAGEPPDAALATRALNVRGAASVQLGIFDMTRGRFDRLDALFDTAIAAYDKVAAMATGGGDAAGEADAAFKAQNARVFKAIGNFSSYLARGDRNAASEKLVEAKRLLAPLEEVTDEESVRFAREMLMSVELDQAFVSAFLASASSDWAAADIAFAQTFELFEKLKIILPPDEVPGFAARETLYRSCVTFFEGQRWTERYRFAEALMRFREIPRMSNEMFEPHRANLTGFQQGLLAKIVPAIDMFLQLSDAQVIYNEAALQAFSGRYEKAIELVESAKPAYRKARDFAVRTMSPQPLRTLCLNLEEIATSLARFLSSIPDRPRLKLNLTAKQEVEIGETVEVAIRLQNDSDAEAPAATCSIKIPTDCEIRKAGGLEVNGNTLRWSGSVSARETRDLDIALQLPNKPGSYYVEAVCESDTAREAGSLKIAASAPTVRSNLGFMRVSLTESQANIAKVVGWVFTLVAGGVIGVWCTKIFH